MDDSCRRYSEYLLSVAGKGRKSERTRARLKAAACGLLEAAPLSQMKVAEICSSAGVAHGTFYVHFRDIRHLVAETLTGFADFLKVTMLKAADSRGEERGRRTTAAYVELFDCNAGLMRQMVSGNDRLPEARDAFERLNREWAEVVVDSRLRRTRRQGREVSPLEREELLRRAYALGGMVDQYLVMLHFGTDATLAAISRDREAIVDTLSLIWERGMEP